MYVCVYIYMLHVHRTRTIIMSCDYHRIIGNKLYNPLPPTASRSEKCGYLPPTS